MPGVPAEVLARPTLVPPLLMPTLGREATSVVPAEVLASPTWNPPLLMPTSGRAGVVAAPAPTEVLDVVKVESGPHEATAAKLRPIYFEKLPLSHLLKTKKLIV